MAVKSFLPFKNRIKARLIELGKKPVELAEHCKIKPYLVYDWLQYRQFPKANVIFDIADFLECSVYYLFYEDDILKERRDAIMSSLSKTIEEMALLHDQFILFHHKLEQAVRDAEANAY